MADNESKLAPLPAQEGGLTDEDRRWLIDLMVSDARESLIRRQREHAEYFRINGRMPAGFGYINT
jgi:hypothetical protein